MVNNSGRNDADAALDERVSLLLSAAAAPSEPGPVPGEEAALAAYRTSLTPTRRRTMISQFLTARTGLAAAVGAGVLLTGGVTAAAAAGGLPGAAQDTARDVLVNFGIEVPGAAEASADHADTRGDSEDARGEEQTETTTDQVDGMTVTDDGETSDDSAEDGKGEEISDLATSTDAEGEEKGAMISGVASDGQSQAGEHEEADDSDDNATVATTSEADETDETDDEVKGDDDADEHMKAGDDSEMGPEDADERREDGDRR